MSIETHISPNKTELAAAAASILTELLADYSSLGLAGGSTPAATYGALRTRDINWTDVSLWIGDERWVAPNDPDNNGRMIRETLLPGLETNFYPVPWEAEISPHDAAQEYEETLSKVFAPSGDPGIVLLGLGDDGHTASLFPETAALNEDERLYVANWVPKFGTWRLTATIPLLRRARQLVFLVSGAGKAEAVRWLVDPKPTDPEAPARRVALSSNKVLVLLDEEAATQL